MGAATTVAPELAELQRVLESASAGQQMEQRMAEARAGKDVSSTRAIREALGKVGEACVMDVDQNERLSESEHDQRWQTQAWKRSQGGRWHKAYRGDHDQ